MLFRSARPARPGAPTDVQDADRAAPTPAPAVAPAAATLAVTAAGMPAAATAGTPAPAAEADAGMDAMGVGLDVVVGAPGVDRVVETPAPVRVRLTALIRLYAKRGDT